MVNSISLRALVGLVCATLLSSPMPPALATGPEEGRIWEPPPAGPAQYAVADPVEETVDTPHGDVHVTVYLPDDGEAVRGPARVPVVLVSGWYSTAYRMTGSLPVHSFPLLGEASPHALFRDLFVPRGYGLVVADPLGTNGSEGCHDYFGQNEIEALSEVVEHVATAAWSDGHIGMIGGSYDGASAIHVAARGTAAARERLDAIIGVEAPVSHYESAVGVDGVPYPGSATSVEATSYALGSSQDPAHLQGTERYECRPQSTTEAVRAEQTGDYTDYWRERDSRPHAENVRSATLLIQGLKDQTVYPSHPAGFFDRLPKATPRMIVLGQWGHFEGPTPVAGGRGDIHEMWLAWFDHYLKGMKNGVDRWPIAQVADPEGQWRAENSWPQGGGTTGQLALGQGGDLGVSSPAGSSSFSEVPGSGGAPSELTFRTDPVTAPLRISGRPIADLWLKFSEPDAHVGVELRVVDSAGAIVGLPTYGSRSARHIDPMVNGYFEQGEGRPAEVGKPLHVPIQFSPTEFVIPSGGRLELVVSGRAWASGVPSSPSGAPVEITLFHECEYPSVLRFRMPKRNFDALNVRDVEPPGTPLSPVAVGPQEVDGGGMARATVCGRDPLDPQEVMRRP